MDAASVGIPAKGGIVGNAAYGRDAIGVTEGSETSVVDCAGDLVCDGVCTWSDPAGGSLGSCCAAHAPIRNTENVIARDRNSITS